MNPRRKEQKKSKRTFAYSKDLLLQDLQTDNMFFDSVVDMIPIKLYVKGENHDNYNPKYFKGQAKESKEARRSAAKQAKRKKLDPNTAETTTQVMKRKAAGNNRPLMPNAFVASAPPLSSFKSNIVSPSKSSDTENGSSRPSKSEVPATPSSTPSNSTKGKSRIETLREKLHAKIAEKRGQRPSDPNTVSKRAARRAEKKKRQEEAQARKKRTSSRAEGNDSNKKFKAANGGAIRSGLGTENKNNNAAQDLAQVDFGRLAGLNSMSPDQYFKANKSLANMSKTKNLQKMLADAESKKQRLQELAQSNDPQDKTKAANIQWGTAIKEASGERVKDDPAKLKKALKRQEAKKSKSAKAWKSRMDQTKAKMDERQKIRNHNLGKRKLGGSEGANLSRKRIDTGDDNDDGKSKGKKGGRRLSRAGFEGRRQEFLNKKKEQ